VVDRAKTDAAVTRHERILEQRPFDDVHGAGRPVVVVQPRLLKRVPADQPHVDVRVAMQLGVEASVTGVLHMDAPQLGQRRDPPGEHFELVQLEVALRPDQGA
jgi:hypothetical protein